LKNNYLAFCLKCISKLKIFQMQMSLWILYVICRKRKLISHFSSVYLFDCFYKTRIYKFASTVWRTKAIFKQFFLCLICLYAVRVRNKNFVQFISHTTGYLFFYILIIIILNIIYNTNKCKEKVKFFCRKNIGLQKIFLKINLITVL
jgi:hypothetical protein